MGSSANQPTDSPIGWREFGSQVTGRHSPAASGSSIPSVRGASPATSPSRRTRVPAAPVRRDRTAAPGARGGVGVIPWHPPRFSCDDATGLVMSPAGDVNTKLARHEVLGAPMHLPGTEAQPALVGKRRDPASILAHRALHRAAPDRGTAPQRNWSAPRFVRL